MRWTTLIALALLAVPTAAAAEVEEHDLPKGWTSPATLRFHDDGALWVTLDGTWALGRIDLATNESTLFPLAANKSSQTDSLWALRFAPDGTIWTGSQTHLHRVDPSTGEAKSYEMPATAYLPGDVYIAPDATIWYALVDANRIFHFDPATERVIDEVPLEEQIGPLNFHASTSGDVYLTSTYAGTYARFDAAQKRLTLVEPRALQAPVGIADSQTALWIAEMGASGITRIEGPRATRYATTPSPYYSATGPAGLLVATDGSIWFAEHFSDRIARLDPANKTLHEYELPSAPGTNTQNIAHAPDGSIWAAEFSANKLARISGDHKSSGMVLPENVTIRAGEKRDVSIPGLDFPQVGSPDENLTLKPFPAKLTIEASETTRPGEYLVLVANRRGAETVGEYFTVLVEPARATPAAGLPALVFVLVLVAIARWRRT